MDIKVGARKLNTTITREMANDLASYHGIDTDAELIAILRRDKKEKRRIKRRKSINKIFNN